MFIFVYFIFVYFIFVYVRNITTVAINLLQRYNFFLTYANFLQKKASFVIFIWQNVKNQPIFVTFCINILRN